MRKWWSLTRVLIRNMQNPFATGKHRKAKTLLFIILLGLAFIPLVLQIGFFFYKLIGALSAVNLHGLALSFGFSAVGMVVFLFGILNVLSVFYFAEDVDILLSLPLRSSHILSSKFTAALVYDYFFVFLFLLPLLVAYGLKMQPGAGYLPTAGLVFLVLPVVPFAIACILVMVVMRFTNFSRNRDRFGKIAGTVLLLFILGLNFVLQRNTGLSENPEQFSQLLASGRFPAIRGIAGVIPGIRFAVESVLHSGEIQGWIWMAFFLGVAGLFVAVFLVIGDRIYFRGVQGSTDRLRSKAAIRSSVSNMVMINRSPITAVWLKDMKILFRDPTLFMNCVLTNFLWPVLFWLVTQTHSSGNEAQMAFLLKQPRLGLFVYAGALGLGLVSTAMNAIASTAISREGKALFVMKIVPVPFGSQIIAKAGTAMVMGAVGSLLLLSFAVVRYHLSAPLIPKTVVMLFLGVVFSGLSGLLIDLHFPKLNWDNAYKAVKQNLNVVIHIVLNMFLAAVVFLALFRSERSADSDFTVLLAVFAGLDLLLLWIVWKRGTRVLEELDA